MTIRLLPDIHIDILINQIAAGEGESLRLRNGLSPLRVATNAQSVMRRADSFIAIRKIAMKHERVRSR